MFEIATTPSFGPPSSRQAARSTSVAPASGEPGGRPQKHSLAGGAPARTDRPAPAARHQRGGSFFSSSMPSRDTAM